MFKKYSQSLLYVSKILKLGFDINCSEILPGFKCQAAGLFEAGGITPRENASLASQLIDTN